MIKEILEFIMDIIIMMSVILICFMDKSDWKILTDFQIHNECNIYKINYY